jgi:hypothetical protein
VSDLAGIVAGVRPPTRDQSLKTGCARRQRSRPLGLIPQGIGPYNSNDHLGAENRKYVILRTGTIDPGPRPVDNAQYVKISGFREARMIDCCCETLQKEGWKVFSHYKLRNPDREIDVYAIHEDVHLVLQLKSTLRPEAAPGRFIGETRISSLV